LCEIRGEVRALLTAERTALNFLQTLSATATLTRRYVDAVAGLKTRIMDTRKTMPSVRMAQKYAVTVGGGHNQRIGLFDGILKSRKMVLRRLYCDFFFNAREFNSLNLPVKS
jgi:nicotinate-nucleotide pyrophosphorylase (carboxylating)